MHLRLGQAAWYDAQDQTSRHSQCRCRFHAQSDRLQSDPHSQIAGGVARVRSQREKLLPASEYTPRPPKPKTRQKDGKCATFQVLQQTAKAVVLQDDINGASSGLHLDQEIHPVCGMSVSWIDLTQISGKFELSIDFHKVT